MERARNVTVDGNEAAASVAHRLSEVVAIYPITPASPMGELADQWSAHGRTNIWGSVPRVVEMQSEAGAAGAVHGALQGGALTTTFTASQGLLLMIPNLYKIAGELNAFCMHVAARTVATHALSIFADHSDVMACRQTGFAMLASGSVQEAQDLACIGHLATLEARLPFLHFFDGFRTSHELSRIEYLDDVTLRSLVDPELVRAHRERALSPDSPVIRGTAQNPDAFFQAREAINPIVDACPEVVQRVCDRFAERTGRAYHLFDYEGDPEAERVVVCMGSAAETVHETVDWLRARGERVGLVRVRLYRPFSVAAFATALPPTVRSVAVLDRTKEPGAVGEPLYQDVVAALDEAHAAGTRGGERPPITIGGRYGLGSKEFTPAMAAAVFAELEAAAPRRHFTVGIVDDVSRTSLDYDEELDIEADDVSRAVFFGLGSDGTVGANKNSIKIITEHKRCYGQGYFVYDSKKAGAVTVSHLRFSPRPIRSTYRIRRAGFVGCHQFGFLDRYDVLDAAAPGAVLLLNSPWGPGEVWDHLAREVQEQIVEKHLQLWVIDAYRVAHEVGLRGRINTIMQTCYFAISGVLPREEAIEAIKAAIARSYGRKGQAVVRRNVEAVDRTLSHLHRVEPPGRVTAERSRPPVVPAEAPDFVRRVTGVLLAGHGDRLPVSAFPIDGTWPLGTSKWEKRAIAQEIPSWDRELCIQCNKCALSCPHAAIRAKVYEPAALEGAPEGFQSTDYRGHEFEGWRYTIQVAPEDCTGCRLCVMVCPAKDRSNPRHKALDLVPLIEVRERERRRYEFFLSLPEPPRERVRDDVKGSQLLEPLFEYSGACAGCGETPYIKLLTQLFGDRTVIANATGCSSIYGGNLPTTPYATNREGRGPAWSNSLFEDNAEFGLGIRLAIDHHRDEAERLVAALRSEIGADLADSCLEATRADPPDVARQRERVAALRQAVARLETPEARRLEAIADYLVPKSVWIVGGDGWAYDIGYGGLDHVLASGADVNLLVLDTQVYSNTGGQQSKATPLGAAAKFAAIGKDRPPKDLALMAMSYAHVYVARIALGARDLHTVRCFHEAEAWKGPSLLIAYSHCIAHGYDLAFGAEQQKRAVASGAWPLLRWDPRRLDAGESPLLLDSGAPTTRVIDYMRKETRFRMVEHEDPARFRRLAATAEREIQRQLATYEQLARLHQAAAAGGEGR